jgi:hypothetical protein
MTDTEAFNALVLRVTLAMRDFTPRQHVELGVIHGMCVEAARKHEPHLIDFLSSVTGLAALSAALSQLPHIVVTSDANGALWAFVRVDATTD